MLYRRKHNQDTELTKLRSVLSVVCRSFFSSIVSIVAIKSEKSPHSYTSPRCCWQFYSKILHDVSSPKALCPVLRHLASFAGRHMGVWTDEAGWTWSRVWLRLHCPELHPSKHTVLACRLVGRTGGLRSRWQEKLSFSLFLLVLADKTTGVHWRDKFPDLFVLFISFLFCILSFFSIKYFSRHFLFPRYTRGFSSWFSTATVMHRYINKFRSLCPAAPPKCRARGYHSSISSRSWGLDLAFLVR